MTRRRRPPDPWRRRSGRAGNLMDPLSVACICLHVSCRDNVMCCPESYVVVVRSIATNDRRVKWFRYLRRRRRCADIPEMAPLIQRPRQTPSPSTAIYRLMSRSFFFEQLPENTGGLSLLGRPDRQFRMPADGLMFYP